MNNFETETEDAEYAIDLYALIHNLWIGTKKFGWLIIVLAIITSGIASFRTMKSFYPYYSASATFAVKLNMNSSNSIYEDSLRASQLSATFPYILTSGVLRNIIATDLGVEYVSEDISAENVEDTNLFTIRVFSDDPNWAYQVLQSVIKNYPQVAETVIGSTYLDMIEESGVPKNPVNHIDYIGGLKTGAMPGVACGIFIIILYAVTRRTIYKLEDLKELSNMKQLGSLPIVVFKKRGNNKERILLNNKKLPPSYVENLYKIRVRIEKIAANKDLKSILVTSAIPGEGKSTFALNLGLALAEEGKKVILVDFDLRRPSVHNMLSLEEEFTKFEKVLQEEIELPEAIYYSEEHKISVLACSKPMKNSSEIIGTAAIGRIMKELKQNYDYVIVDTAPATIMSDTTDLAMYVDGAVFMVKQDYAKVNYIVDALEHLVDSSNIEMIGCVLNCMNTSFYNYGYGYGYGSYGKYGYGKYGYGKRKHKGTANMQSSIPDQVV